MCAIEMSVNGMDEQQSKIVAVAAVDVGVYFINTLVSIFGIYYD